MNTIFERYGHSVRSKQYTKKTNAKHAMKAEISLKTISFSDSAKRLAFSAGLRPNYANRCLFFDVIWKMAMVTSVDTIDSSHRKRFVLRI